MKGYRTELHALLLIAVWVARRLAGGFALILLVMGAGSQARSQSLATTSFQDSSIQYALQLYTTYVGPASRLYSGSQYREFELHEYDSGHAYFVSSEWLRGSVHYDGLYYTDVYMLYNLITDRLIIENPYDNNRIELLEEQVSDFTLTGHRFVRLTLDSAALFSRNGFYDELYGGVTAVYARRTKELVQKIENGKERKIFNLKNRYFIKVHGDLVQVTGKSSVLRALEDRKVELKKVVSKNPFSFRSRREEWIAWVARSYDELPHTP